jgi:hypothetical protein
MDNWFFSQQKTDWRMKLNTHLHLVSKLRMRGALPPHPYEVVFNPQIQVFNNSINTYNIFIA